MLKLVEIKGDIKFYEDPKGKLYQQIADNNIYRVVDGKIKHKKIKSCGDYSIVYNLNGVYGFSIKDNKTGFILEDRFWSLKEVNAALNLFN